MVNTVPEASSVWLRKWNILVPIKNDVPFRNYRNIYIILSLKSHIFLSPLLHYPICQYIPKFKNWKKIIIKIKIKTPSTCQNFNHNLAHILILSICFQYYSINQKKILFHQTSKLSIWRRQAHNLTTDYESSQLCNTIFFFRVLKNVFIMSVTRGWRPCIIRSII